MEPKLCLVTQGPVAERMFFKLLEPEFGKQVRVLSGGTFTEAATLARTVVEHHKWVMVVTGSGSRRREVIWESRGFMEFMVGQAGYFCRRRWRSMLLVPDVEVLLFHDPSILRQLLGRELTEDELARGRKRPRRVLEELLGLKSFKLNEELCRRLETMDLSPLSSHRVVQKARVFFRNRLKEFAREAAKAATRPSWRPGGPPPGAGAG